MCWHWCGNHPLVTAPSHPMEMIAAILIAPAHPPTPARADRAPAACLTLSRGAYYRRPA
jgi:hypothetical protein